jgi:membrane protease subunit HflC
VDTLKYIQSVQNERGAKARLDSIIDANTRDVISNHNLVEAVRNTNEIFELMQKRKDEREVEGEKVEEEISGEIEKVLVGREQLSEQIAKKSDEELRPFGIQIIDVQLRRISYEKSVEQKVYERMVSERKRIAEKIRSIGKGEKAKILGRLSRDLQKIESEAYQKAETIKGKGQANALAIYNRSFSKNQKFYYFMKTLEGYKKSLKSSKMILGPQLEYLKGLKTLNFDN